MGPPVAIAASASRRASAQNTRHADFLGLNFCLSAQSDVIRLIVDRPGAPYRYVVTPNSFHVATAHDDPERLLPIFRGAWLSLCDSQIVRALARLRGLRLPLVTGSDLVAALLADLDRTARHAPRRVLVVGPPRDALPRLAAAFRGVTFDSLPAPSGLAQDAELRLAVARACLERNWDIALLCVGCPAQELIAGKLAELGRQSGVALCVGASIDFLIGVQHRAPRFLQRFGLEWAYRLAREPKRLWRRYIVTSPRIFHIFMATHPPREN